MKYRAVLSEPNLAAPERAKQIFGESLAEMERWAKLLLGASQDEDAAVTVYEQQEVEVAKHGKAE